MEEDKQYEFSGNSLKVPSDLPSFNEIADPSDLLRTEMKVKSRDTMYSQIFVDPNDMYVFCIEDFA